ncbi:MAG: Crp/Fnr family transcriptional regulator [Bacteroidota bacterium]
MYEQFWKFTDMFVHFSDKERSSIREYLITRDVPKNHLLVDLGDISSEVFFINKGCVRFYYLTEAGEEITGFIFTENMFTGSHESFFSQTPSTQVLQTLEPCELVVLPYEGLQTLFDTVPKMNIFVRKLLEQRMSHAQKVVASLIMNKPEKRYTSMLELQPDLVNRIPQQVLATYLGITPVSLSRIRKRIMDQD